jgi:hypothetical protein
VSDLLRKLLRHLLLSVDGEGDPDPAAAAPEPDVEPALEDVLPDAEPTPEPTPETPRERELRMRAENAEADRDAWRGRASAPQQPPQQQRNVDPDYDREEAQLAEMRRAGASEENLRWANWQIGQQRETRAANRTAQAAIVSSRDAADSAQFTSFLSSEKRNMQPYLAEVERRVQENLRLGLNIPRRAILAFVIGEKTLEAKPQPKKAATGAKPAAPADRQNQQRVRSDVTGRGAPKRGKGNYDHMKDVII